MPKALILYHFFPPDEVVSAALFGELSRSLVDRGWDVIAFPCNRSYRNEPVHYSAYQCWQGVSIQRVWRPPFAQSSGVGRLINAFWMLARWSLLSLNPKVRPDIMVVGTDPILSVLIALVWRRFKPRTKIVHWCFDLYPEAAIAAGVLKSDSAIVKALRSVLRRAYATCDLIIDIGSCMRERLQQYKVNTPMSTLVPWALEEPSEVVAVSVPERATIFGKTKAALMYSGSLGKAHSTEDIIELARLLRPDDVKIAFSISKSDELTLRATLANNDLNVIVIPPAPMQQLAMRLSTAEIHIVSLREAWTGTVIPSKFFGALAIGRPVLFCGSPQSAIARWILEFGVGWVLAPGTALTTAIELKRFISDRSEVEKMFKHCHTIYRRHFSKTVTLDGWDHCLRDLL